MSQMRKKLYNQKSMTILFYTVGILFRNIFEYTWPRKPMKILIPSNIYARPYMGFFPYWHSQWQIHGISGASVQYGKSSSSHESLELEVKRCDNGEPEWFIDVAAEPDPEKQKIKEMYLRIGKKKRNEYEKEGKTSRTYTLLNNSKLKH